MPTTAVGVDIGGTKLLGIAASADAPTTPVAEDRVATPDARDVLLDAVDRLVQRLDPAGAGPVGIGLPGLVDRSGRFRVGPNLPALVEVDVGTELSDRLGRRVVVDNDATCAARAEFSGGAGAGHRDGVLVTLGTGIGGGIVVDGVTQRGANGFAGEIGHMVIAADGPACPCGRDGCWETFASGTGLGRLGQRAVDAGRAPTVQDLASGAAVRGEHVVAAARSGATDALAVLDDFAGWIAAGVANLVSALDPGAVILGGGVAEEADLFLPRVRDELAVIFHGWRHRPRVPVEVAAFGARAGAIGAAVMALDPH